MSLFSRTERLAFFERQLDRPGVFPLVAGSAAAICLWRIVTTTRTFIDVVGVDPAALTGISLLIAGAGVAASVHYWRERRRRGKLIVDCGPGPFRAAMIGLSVIFSLTFSNRAVEELQGFSIFLATFPLFFLASCCGRLKIYEEGLWIYFGLMEWCRIGGYEWSEDGAKLLLRGKKFEKWMTSEIPIAPQHRDVISQCLDASIVTDEQLTPFNSIAMATPSGGH